MPPVRAAGRRGSGCRRTARGRGDLEGWGRCLARMAAG